MISSAIDDISKGVWMRSEAEIAASCATKNERMAAPSACRAFFLSGFASSACGSCSSSPVGSTLAYEDACVYMV